MVDVLIVVEEGVDRLDGNTSSYAGRRGWLQTLVLGH